MTAAEIYKTLGVSGEVLAYGEKILETLRPRFVEIDARAEINQAKVLAAMQKNRVNATHFAASTGYGYDDEGRDNLERVYADAFHTEAALVRPQITCGTHALAVALSANLLPGDELLVHTIYGDKTCKLNDVLLEKCLCCKGKAFMVADDEAVTGEPMPEAPKDRFAMVAKLEMMTPDQRFEFWRGELSRCIRCNACRDVCPACTCEKCVFDNPNSGVENKAAANSFEEKMFHIIRAFHVAGRCTDCGECSRVCPQHIPLHLLNRKFIKDIDAFYGDYQAGEEVGSRAPLVNYTQGDLEPSEAVERGNHHE